MTVINEKLTSAIHTVLETVPHSVKITIVQPKNEHNIPWHYINKEYLFKLEASKGDYLCSFTEDQEAMMEHLFTTYYATSVDQLASMVRTHLCFYIGCDLLDLETVEKYETETGEELQVARCCEDEEVMGVGHRLIANVQMLEWHWENERKANDPFWGQDDLVEVNAPW
ncbi:MAG: hypothetical protein ACRDCE_22830 [Cetobacterium sp.]|uniref:hypothetical protein n=1 Tax=Cetobacterium sp. TaxID=2071632 RepID=UPI003EE69B33